MAILRKIIPIDVVVSKIISEQRMQHRSINEILPLSQIVYVIGKKLLKNDSSSAILKAKQFQLNRAVESQHLSNSLSLIVTLVIYFDFLDNL